MDPYTKILKITRNEGSKDNPPSISIGKVISPPPNLMVSKTKDLQLYKDDIYIADYLLSGYSRQVSITGGTGTAINMLDTINNGDLLAIMPTSDLQTWIVLCKVVRT